MQMCGLLATPEDGFLTAVLLAAVPLAACSSDFWHRKSDPALPSVDAARREHAHATDSGTLKSAQTKKSRALVGRPAEEHPQAARKDTAGGSGGACLSPRGMAIFQHKRKRWRKSQVYYSPVSGAGVTELVPRNYTSVK